MEDATKRARSIAILEACPPFRRLLRTSSGIAASSPSVSSASSSPGRWRSPAPAVLGFAIDDLTRGVTRAKLGGYGALLLAIGLVGGVFLFLQRRILIGASRDIEYDMRNDFFAHLQTLPLAYFQAHRTGDLMSRATNDLNAVRMMIGPSIMYSANTHADLRRRAVAS